MESVTILIGIIVLLTLGIVVYIILKSQNIDILSVLSLTSSTNSASSTSSSLLSATNVINSMYQYIAVSAIDYQIYVKKSFVATDSYFQLTFLKNSVNFVSTLQLTDGYVYGFGYDVANPKVMNLYKITNDIASYDTTVVVNDVSKITPTYDLNIYPTIDGIAVSYAASPLTASFVTQDIDGDLIVIDNQGFCYKKTIKTTKGFALTLTSMTYDATKPYDLQKQFVNSGVLYTITNYDNQFVPISNGMGDLALSGVKKKILKLKYMSDGTIVCICDDNYLYIKETLSSYPIKLPNNTLILVDVCVTPDDIIYGVGQSTGKVFQRIGGLYGSWSTVIEQSCCCLSLNIFQ